MVEATFKKDSYGRNLLYKDNEAIIRQIYNLCIMKKGTDVLNLDKGCDILSYRYEFSDNATINKIQQEIRQQIIDYTPYEVSSVICKSIKNNSGNYILHVFISLNSVDSIINIATDGNKSSLALINT